MCHQHTNFLIPWWRAAVFIWGPGKGCLKGPVRMALFKVGDSPSLQLPSFQDKIQTLELVRRRQHRPTGRDRGGWMLTDFQVKEEVAVSQRELRDLSFINCSRLLSERIRRRRDCVVTVGFYWIRFHGVRSLCGGRYLMFSARCSGFKDEAG